MLHEADHDGLQMPMLCGLPVLLSTRFAWLDVSADPPQTGVGNLVHHCVHRRKPYNQIILDTLVAIPHHQRPFTNTDLSFPLYILLTAIIMTYNLSSRFSDSTIASASSSFSKISSASSASSVEDLLFSSIDTITKPPPRTSSITLASTKNYYVESRREREKPAPLKLTTSNRSTASTDEESFHSCKEHPRNSRRSSEPKCFCGSAVRASTSSRSIEIYCSRECARQDALYALEGRSPTTSHPSAPCSDDEEEEDFPVTPTNAFVPSPPRTPTAKVRTLASRHPSLTRKLTGLGASHYRRMEALGLYDADTTPTRPSKSSPLLEPIDLMVAHSPTGKSRQLLATIDGDEEDEDLEFNPRKTLFFPVPIYMGSPLQS